jgi:hypothetical protein
LLKNYSYALISHWRSGDETFEVIIGGTSDGKRIVFKTHLVRDAKSSNDWSFIRIERLLKSYPLLIAAFR